MAKLRSSPDKEVRAEQIGCVTKTLREVEYKDKIPKKIHSMKPDGDLKVLYSMDTSYFFLYKFQMKFQLINHRIFSLSSLHFN